MFLRVTARREDGFHDLASLFQVIDVGDHLEIAIDDGATGAGTAENDHRGGDTLLCEDKTIPTDGRNLIIKAFEEFRLRTGRTERFIAHLDKRVHQGAGLGGGSANASTALFAANKLCDGIATEDELQNWSGNVGSDCPVFFSHGAAFCTGRGEVVVDLKPPPLGPTVPLLLVKPSSGLSTKQIFQALQLDSRSEADPEALLSELASAGSCDQRLCVNDLEPPAFAVMPELETLKSALQGTRSAHSRTYTPHESVPDAIRAPQLSDDCPVRRFAACSCRPQTANRASAPCSCQGAAAPLCAQGPIVDLSASRMRHHLGRCTSSRRTLSQGRRANGMMMCKHQRYIFRMRLSLRCLAFIS